MKEWLFGWVQDIAFYTLLMVVVLHVLPDKNQRKYLQFFMGVVMIIVVLSPVFQFTGMEQKLDAAYARQTYDQEQQEFQQKQAELEEQYQEILEEQLEEAQTEMEQQETDKEQETEKQEEQEQEGTDIGIEGIQIKIDTMEED